MRAVLQSCNGSFCGNKAASVGRHFSQDCIFGTLVKQQLFHKSIYSTETQQKCSLKKNLILCLKIICAFSDLRLNVLCDPEITVKVWKHLHIISLLKHTSHYVQILNIEMSRLLQELTGVVTFGNLELVLKGNGIGKKSGPHSWEQKFPSTPGSNKLWLRIQFLSLNLVF